MTLSFLCFAAKKKACETVSSFVLLFYMVLYSVIENYCFGRLNQFCLF